MISEQDKMFLAFVKQHRNIGYGRMMQIISNAWYESLKDGHPASRGGVLVGTCLVSVPQENRSAFFAELQYEKQQGMEY